MDASNSAQLELPTALQLAAYDVTLEALTPLELPPYGGSTLRGGFGHVFKRSVCIQPDRLHCAGCPLRPTCVYAAVFEPAPPSDSEVLRKNEAVPPPFVLELPLTPVTLWPPGAHLTFRLVLVGRAIGYTPHFLAAFRALGEQGLGRRRGRYRLHTVEAVQPLTQATATVYAEGALLALPDMQVSSAHVAAHAQQYAAERLTITFLTPTRLQHAGRLAQHGPPFAVLVKALLGRVSSLAYFHCGQRWETDFRGWIDRAAEVEMTTTDTTWVDWGRFSGRQQQRIEMGGLVGTAAYSGALAPYRALLALGALIHVGKGTVFGNGRLQLA